MSRKKHKKRHSQTVMDAKRQLSEAKLAEEKDRAKNRMDPIARTMLLGDVVFLAICQLLYQGGMMSEFVSGATTLIGVVILLLALWFQFGPKGHGPRLK